MKNLSVYICIILALFAIVQCKPKKIVFESAFDNLDVDIPVDMDAPDKNYIYVSSLDGQVFKFANNDATTTKTTFLDLPNSDLAFYPTGLAGDEGLLCIEFHPEYPEVPKVYAVYTPTTTSLAIVAFTVTSGVVDYDSVDVLFNITRPLAKNVGITEAYLGGDLRFALEPEDENAAEDYYSINNDDDSDDEDSDDDNDYCEEHSCVYNLYISVGYGNDDFVTSNSSNLLGKLLRVTPHTTTTGFSIPSGNAGSSPIYAKGFRNPRKIYFSEKPAYLFVGDVGDVYDEINVIEKNRNYGWNNVEGCTNNLLYDNPIYSYSSDSQHTITQGPYYPENGKIKSIRGRMLFADLYSGILYSYKSANFGGACSETPTPVAGPTGDQFFLISSILIVDKQVIVSNVLGGAYFGLPSFFRLVEVDT